MSNLAGRPFARTCSIPPFRPPHHYLRSCTCTSTSQPASISLFAPTNNHAGEDKYALRCFVSGIIIGVSGGQSDFVHYFWHHVHVFKFPVRCPEHPRGSFALCNDYVCMSELLVCASQCGFYFCQNRSVPLIGSAMEHMCCVCEYAGRIISNFGNIHMP